MKNYLIVIAGPTASGKTSLGIQLSQHFNAPILSADSRQFYKEMSIGTAKPTHDELNAAPHHFIDTLSIQDDYSVGDYEKDAITLLDKKFSKNNIAILLGGSGLYIKAVLEGLDVFPEVKESIKNYYIQLHLKEGVEVLQNELKEKDPIFYQKVDIQNPHRLIRALSVIKASGKPFSNFQNQEKKNRNFEPIIINLQWEREELYKRINDRVDLMMENGQLEEARSLFHLKDLNALQTVGYQELFEFFDQKISLVEAIELIKRNSRRYAKRQMTWFRKMENSVSFHPSKLQDILNYIASKLNN